MPLGILLADDHATAHQGLKGLLEREGFAVLGEAGDAAEAVRLAQGLRPDVVILDLDGSLLDAVGTAREMCRSSSTTNAILLAARADDPRILQGLRVGVRGLVLKGRARGELGRAVREVSQGRIYVSPGISRAFVQVFLAESNPPALPLTRRERQVLQLVAEGKRSKEIGTLLGVSVKTVESHRTRLMRKLDIHETAGLVRYAIRQGLIRP